MTIAICPGYHPPEMTIDFLKGLERYQGESGSSDIIIYPADRLPPYSSLHLFDFLRQLRDRSAEERHQKLHSLLFISFSAGVVAAIGAAHLWQAAGGTVKAVIAIDGWGVPVGGNFPIHRMSHDAFTHWSSALLGGGEESFYADPAVRHLDLWRTPQQIYGYRVNVLQKRRVLFPEFPDRYQQNRYQRITAAALLNYWLNQYGEGKIP